MDLLFLCLFYFEERKKKSVRKDYLLMVCLDAQMKYGHENTADGRMVMRDV